MTPQDTTLIVGMINKIAQDNSFNKALNMVLLNELSQLTNSDFLWTGPEGQGDSD